MVQLSKRLLAVAKMVSPGGRVADIGCDHAYLSIYLMENQISREVIACDINAGPIAIAKENIRRAGYDKQIECRQGNGLAPLRSGEVDTVVISGMGGHLVMDILTAGADILKNVKEIVIGAQSDLSLLRHFLCENGYRIASEDFVYEDNKYYPILKVVKGKADFTDEVYYRYGKCLLEAHHEVLSDFLHKEQSYLASLLSDLEARPESEAVLERKIRLGDDHAICVRALEIINCSN